MNHSVTIAINEYYELLKYFLDASMLIADEVKGKDRVELSALFLNQKYGLSLKYDLSYVKENNGSSWVGFYVHPFWSKKRRAYIFLKDPDSLRHEIVHYLYDNKFEEQSTLYKGVQAADIKSSNEGIEQYKQMENFSGWNCIDFPSEDNYLFWLYEQCGPLTEFYAYHFDATLDSYINTAQHIIDELSSNDELLNAIIETEARYSKYAGYPLPRILSEKETAEYKSFSPMQKEEYRLIVLGYLRQRKELIGSSKTQRLLTKYKFKMANKSNRIFQQMLDDFAEWLQKPESGQNKGKGLGHASSESYKGSLVKVIEDMKTFSETTGMSVIPPSVINLGNVHYLEEVYRLISDGQKDEAIKLVADIQKALEKCIEHYRENGTLQSKNGKKLRDEHSALAAFLNYLSKKEEKTETSEVDKKNNNNTQPERRTWRELLQPAPVAIRQVMGNVLKITYENGLIYIIRTSCGINLELNTPSLYPAFLSQGLCKYLHPEYSDGDQKLLEDVLEGIEMAADIIANGDNPIYDDKTLPPYNAVNLSEYLKGINVSDPEDSHYGLSARRLKTDRDKTFTDKTYYWMSWLKGRIPVCIAPPNRIKQEEGDSDLLGCYIHRGAVDRPLICIFPTQIGRAAHQWQEWPTAVRDLTVITIIHEFAHAIMDECWSEDAKGFDFQDMIPKEDPIRHEEEAFANGIMLNYLERWSASSNTQEAMVLLANAKEFAKSQPSGYNQGEEYMKEDWYEWYLVKRKQAKQQKENKPKDYLLR